MSTAESTNPFIDISDRLCRQPPDCILRFGDLNRLDNIDAPAYITAGLLGQSPLITCNTCSCEVSSICIGKDYTILK